MDIKATLRDLKKQMREAAKNENFEAAILLRDAARRLTAKVEAPTNVFQIKTGEAFIPPNNRAKTNKRPVDQTAIHILKQALDMAKSGEMVGVALVSGFARKDAGCDDVDFVLSSSVMDYPRLFIGGATALAHYIAQIEYEVEEDMADEFDDDDGSAA